MPVDKHVVNLESLCKKYGDKLELHWLRVLVNMTGFNFSIKVLSQHNLVELRWTQDKCNALTTRDERRKDVVKERKRKLKIHS